jgi:hypothetical protein
VFLLCLAGVAAGCGLAEGTDRDGTRERAVEQALTTARYTDENLVDLISADDRPTGRALLTAVAGAVPDSPGETFVYGLELVDDDTALLAVAVDGYDQSGTGNEYYDFRARVCLRFLVSSGDAPEVEAEDDDCRQEDLDAVGRVPAADEVVGYDD